MVHRTEERFGVQSAISPVVDLNMSPCVDDNRDIRSSDAPGIDHQCLESLVS
jgi:hypothetical protein